jgi:hypothetical protein
VDEKSRRNLFCFIVVELSFLYATPIAAFFSAVPPVSPARKTTRTVSIRLA